MKNVLLIFYCMILSLLTQAQFLNWNDLIKENGGSSSNVADALVYSNGNSLIAGRFKGTIDLDPNPTNFFQISSPSGSSGNLYFAKYDQDGDFIFGKHIWGRTNITTGGIASNSAGQILMTGSFNDTIDLNPDNNIALYTPLITNASDIFLVKYNSSGLFQWARQMNSSLHATPNDIALDQSGNIIIAGTFKGTTDFDAGPGLLNLTSVDEDIFIAKYNSSGNYIRAISIGSSASTTGFQQLSKLDVDASNNIYISGRFEGSVDFDPSAGFNVLKARGANDFYIAKYNSSLQLVWVYQLGSGSDEGRITHQIYGNDLWLAGSFKDTIDANLKSGTALHISNGLTDVFFAKYNLSANYSLSKSLGASGADEAISIDVFNDDSLYISGHFQGTVDFDPSSGTKNLTSASSRTTFFTSYNSTGDLNWASKISGSSDVTNSLIKSDIKGNPYVMGNLLGTANFNANSVFTKNYTGPGSFIAKYQKCGKADINVNTIDATCGNRDGSASATVLGGTLPLRYFWTSGSVKSTADSLRSGMYYLTVKDTLECAYYSDPVLINESGGPTISVVTILDVTCNGGNNGAIVINVTGGTAPYKYEWSNGSTAQNINGLTAGNYECTVIDKNHCKSFLRIAINEPDPMVIFPVVSKPSCGMSNGSVTAVVTGGSPTYSYSWLPSGSGNTLFSIGAGVYKVTVTDVNSCTFTKSIGVSDDNAPDIYVDSVVNASCGNGGGGIYVSVYGGNPTYSYLWNPGSYTSQDISSVPAGNYELFVTDNSGCKAVLTETLGASRPVTPEICIVDVDSLSGNATIVWEKPTSRGSIDYFNIYRETTTLNVFDLIKDKIDFKDLSLYEDPIADTWTRPWSYKISQTDTCGIESDKSDYHTTIHAVITKNAQQEFNVLWSPYRGNFPVSKYTVLRYTNSSGVDSLTTVPANIFTYTDKSSPSKKGDVYYFIRVVHPTGCTATEAQNRNSARSNRGSIMPPTPDSSTSVKVYENTDIELIVFPNPAKNEFNIQLSSEVISNGQIALYATQGNVIWEKELLIERGLKTYNFSVNDLPKGLYIIKVVANGETYINKLMIDSR